tara:strand:- start:164 stop:427 length:264 start_codon:yes stop_codon:yes gene_type:complete
MGIFNFIVNLFSSEPEKPEIPKDITEGIELDKFPKKVSKPKRARTKKGRYVKDDKSTPNINEAWIGGKAPKKTTKKKKKVGRPKKKK